MHLKHAGIIILVFGFLIAGSSVGAADAALTEKQKMEIHRRIVEKYGHLTPEQRAEKLHELRMRRRALKNELEHLPPEERMERMEELQYEFRQQEKGPIRPLDGTRIPPEEVIHADE